MYDKCSACKYGDAENLRLENQELKKQLEISEANEETYYLELRQIGECLGLNKECIVENIYQKINEIKKQLEAKENQQKEFIEWLKNEINKCEYGEKNYADSDDMSYHNENELRKEILSKYKEIIGGKDE